jgi:hypothetical protein
MRETSMVSGEVSEAFEFAEPEGEPYFPAIAQLGTCQRCINTGFSHRNLWKTRIKSG